MNERIKELLAQSTKEVWGNDQYNGSPAFEGYEVDQEKFAELIVKECVKRIQGCHLAEGYDPSIVDEYEMGYKKGIDKATSQVLLHFGVE